MPQSCIDNECKQKCAGCSDCCQYATAIIAKPQNKQDLEEIIWQILHGIEVEIDSDGDWLLTIYQPCKALDKNGHCTIYANRPSICREHLHTECARYLDDDSSTVFHTRDEFLDYIASQPEFKKMYE